MYRAEDGDSSKERTIYNATGCSRNGEFYHYVKGHLGNICAVVNSEDGESVQQTMYYASGVPMPEKPQLIEIGE